MLTRRQLLDAHEPRHRRARADLAAQPAALRRRRARARRAARSRRRTSPPRRSASSTSSSPAGRRSSTCSTTSRSSTDLFDKDLPDSVRKGQRLTGMTSGQTPFPIVPSKFKFTQHGKSGTWVSELLPHTAQIADDLCFVRSMHTEAINHDPAITFMQTGNQLPGRPSIGAWVDYGLGSENERPARVRRADLARAPANPAPGDCSPACGAAASCRRKHQGVKFRGNGDPVLYLTNPAGVDPRRPPRHARRPRRAQRACATTRSATPRSRRASRSTRWPSGCRRACRS